MCYNGPHKPGPGARSNFSSFRRLWIEKAGALCWPYLLMLEGSRYFGPGEQLVLCSLWRAPKENTGALLLVRSCWWLPLTNNKSRPFWLLNPTTVPVISNGHFSFTCQWRQCILRPRVTMKGSYRSSWLVGPPGPDPWFLPCLERHCLERKKN